jgi:hypothetical protein
MEETISSDMTCNYRTINHPKKDSRGFFDPGRVVIYILCEAPCKSIKVTINCMVNLTANIDETAKDVPEHLLFFRTTGRDQGHATGEIRTHIC